MKITDHNHECIDSVYNVPYERDKEDCPYTNYCANCTQMLPKGEDILFGAQITKIRIEIKDHLTD